MQNVIEKITIAAAADEVWALVGDTANVADWVPAIAGSWQEADIRHATFEGGGDARERIVSVDDAGRTYTYEYLDGPLALESYVSTLTVLEDGDGATVTWTADFSAANAEEEGGLADAISGIYSSGLAVLSARFSR